MKLHKRAKFPRRYRPFFYNHYVTTENGLRWMLLHPVETATSVIECVRAAWHRAMWGWDVSDVWMFKTHLALVMPPMLRQLKEGVSYSTYVWLGGKAYADPNDGTELYMAMLESCAQAFEHYYFVHHEDDDWSFEKYEEARKAVEIALAILGENYDTLWD